MKLTRIRLLFASIFLLLASLCYVTYKNLSGYIREVGSVRHTNVVINTAREMLSTIKDAETGHRGFQLSGDSSYLTPYYNARKVIPKKFKELDSLSTQFKFVNLRIDTLGYLINKQFVIIEQILDFDLREGPTFKADELKLLNDGKANMDLIRRITDRIIIDQQNRATKSLENEGGFKTLTPISFLTTALIACGGVLFLFTRIVTALNERDKKAKELTAALTNLQTQKVNIEYTQNMLQKVLDNSLAGIFALKCQRNSENEVEDFIYEMANESSFDLINKTPTELIGHKFLSISPAQLKLLYDDFKEVVHTGTTFSKEIQRLINNEEAWFKLVAVKLEDGCVVTFTDITSDKLTELKKEKFTLELKRSNEDLEQFAYVASHDLQEPLRKIRSFGDRLSAKYSNVLDEVGRDYIDRMQIAAKRMQTLIEDLLSFSRVSSSSEEFTNLNLEYILDEISDDLSDQIRRKNASVVFSSSPPILGISSQVKRLFQNIVSNGIKFSKPDIDPMIVITSKVVTHAEVAEEFSVIPSSPTYVRIEVTDNGIGFNQKYASQIFNIFQRLHGKSEFEGTGIGLAICRRIVTNHEGFIKATSEEGVGSKFIIILPSFTEV